MCLCKGFNANGVVLKACQFQLQFLIFLSEEDHLFCQCHVFLHLIIDTSQQLPILAPVDAIILDQHEHVAPPVVLILFKLLVLCLKTLQISYVLTLYAYGIVLELVPYLSISVLESCPIGIQSTD